MKLLVVDDEEDLQEILQYNLVSEGYEVSTASSAEEALAMDLASFDLILLDVMMSGMSGFDMARRMKQNDAFADIPIIFITALGGEEERVEGLDLGADDYISKPLSMREVKARVKAVLRRSGRIKAEPSSASTSCLSFGTLELNMDSKTVTLDGQPLLLSKLEFELLHLFLSNIGKVFEREDLLLRCWPKGTVVLDRTVDVSITRLRKKIGHYGQNIRTRFGYGYVFE